MAQSCNAVCPRLLQDTPTAEHVLSVTDAACGSLNAGILVQRGCTCRCGSITVCCACISYSYESTLKTGPQLTACSASRRSHAEPDSMHSSWLLLRSSRHKHVPGQSCPLLPPKYAAKFLYSSKCRADRSALPLSSCMSWPCQLHSMHVQPVHVMHELHADMVQAVRHAESPARQPSFNATALHHRPLTSTAGC